MKLLWSTEGKAGSSEWVPSSWCSRFLRILSRSHFSISWKKETKWWWRIHSQGVTKKDQTRSQYFTSSGFTDVATQQHQNAWTTCGNLSHSPPSVAACCYFLAEGWRVLLWMYKTGCDFLERGMYCLNPIIWVSLSWLCKAVQVLQTAHLEWLMLKHAKINRAFYHTWRSCWA